MISENQKRRATKLVAWGSWIAALANTVWLGFLPTDSHAKQILGPMVVLLIGVAILAGLSMARHKLSDTIVAALQTGYKMSGENARERMREIEAKNVEHAKNMEERAQAMDERARASWYDHKRHEEADQRREEDKESLRLLGEISEQVKRNGDAMKRSDNK